MSGFRGNARWALLGEGTQAASGIVMFIGLTQLLPIADVAVITTIGAFVAMASSVSTCGANILLLRRIGSSDAGRESFGRAIASGFVGNSLALVVLAMLHRWLLPEASLFSYAALIAGQLVVLYLIDLCVVLTAGTARLSVGFLIRATSAMIRLCGFAAFWYWGGGIQGWATAFLTSASIALLGALAIVRVRFGFWPDVRSFRRSDLREGIPYALGNSAESVMVASDRPVLQSNGFVDDNARYGVGARVVAIATLPITALLQSGDSALYRAGAQGMTVAWAAARKLFLAVTVVGLLIVPGMWIIAWCAPLLGADYEEATAILQALSLIPLVRGIQYVAGNLLTAGGHQSTRTRLVAGAAVGNLLANLLLVPMYSWKAAIATTYAAEVFLFFAFVRTARRLSVTERVAG